MKRNEYANVTENFSEYANKEVEYKRYLPSCDKTINCKGKLHGIGIDGNSELLIIESYGHHAIHYKDVDFK